MKDNLLQGCCIIAPVTQPSITVFWSSAAWRCVLAHSAAEKIMRCHIAPNRQAAVWLRGVVDPRLHISTRPLRSSPPVFPGRSAALPLSRCHTHTPPVVHTDVYLLPKAERIVQSASLLLITSQRNAPGWAGLLSNRLLFIMINFSIFIHHCHSKIQLGLFKNVCIVGILCFTIFSTVQ